MSQLPGRSTVLPGQYSLPAEDSSFLSDSSHADEASASLLSHAAQASGHRNLQDSTPPSPRETYRWAELGNAHRLERKSRSRRAWFLGTCMILVLGLMVLVRSSAALQPSSLLTGSALARSSNISMTCARSRPPSALPQSRGNVAIRILCPDVCLTVPASPDSVLTCSPALQSFGGRQTGSACVGSRSHTPMQIRRHAARLATTLSTTRLAPSSSARRHRCPRPSSMLQRADQTEQAIPTSPF